MGAKYIVRGRKDTTQTVLNIKRSVLFFLEDFCVCLFRWRSERKGAFPASEKTHAIPLRSVLFFGGVLGTEGLRLPFPLARQAESQDSSRRQAKGPRVPSRRLAQVPVNAGWPSGKICAGFKGKQEGFTERVRV